MQLMKVSKMKIKTLRLRREGNQRFWKTKSSANFPAYAGRRREESYQWHNNHSLAQGQGRH